MSAFDPKRTSGLISVAGRIRHRRVTLDHAVLNLNSTARGVDGACKLNQDAIAGSLDDAAATLSAAANTVTGAAASASPATTLRLVIEVETACDMATSLVRTTERDEAE